MISLGCGRAGTLAAPPCFRVPNLQVIAMNYRWTTCKGTKTGWNGQHNWQKQIIRKLATGFTMTLSNCQRRYARGRI
ncbi:hypothetical protein AN672_29550, partial [Citrobacter freundii]